ncbi:MAG TPA: TetR family transcriptional regulator [Candidatus Dormibacteraeota bacterium]
MSEPVALGLRERKKQRTRAAIQREALRLFESKGFDATTVEEIAEAADIAPSTFFTYFPSKVAVALQDELDPLIIEALNAQPPEVPPISALRNAMRSTFSVLTPEQERMLRQRMRVMASDPALSAAVLNQFSELLDEVANVVAGRTGVSPDDFAVQNLSGAILGVVMATYRVIARNPDIDLNRLLDDALAHLEAGLPLPVPAQSSGSGAPGARAPRSAS